MLLTAKAVNKFKNLADSMGPNLSGSPFGNARTEEFDYELTKILYELFSKGEKKIILKAPNNETVKMDAGHYEEILKMMAQQDNSASGYEMYMNEVMDRGKKTRFNLLLKETLHSFEQMVHQNSFADKMLPKTKDGKINHFYRAFMRSLIANKERHLELIGFNTKGEQRATNNRPFGSNLEEVRKEFKEESSKHAKTYMSQEEIARSEVFNSILSDATKESSKVSPLWAKLAENKKL